MRDVFEEIAKILEAPLPAEVAARQDDPPISMFDLGELSDLVTSAARDLENVKGILISEIVRVHPSLGRSDGERDDAIQVIQEANSPQQLQAALLAFHDVMAGKPNGERGSGQAMQ